MGQREGLPARRGARGEVGRVSAEPSLSRLSPSERERIKQAALASARAAGCTCSPYVRVRSLGRDCYGSTVSHDDECPLAAGRDQVVLLPDEGTGAP
jgi:hypothetical protein